MRTDGQPRDDSRHTFRSRIIRPVLATALCAAFTSVGLPMTAASAAAPSVSGGGTVTYLERDPALAIGDGLTITGGSYGGSYVEFAVNGAAGTETLDLARGDAPSTSDGVVTIVGSLVYLGNGSTANRIGWVDSVKDGASGKPLRVNFTSGVTNPGFETGDLRGWTAMNQQIFLGQTSIAGHVPLDRSTYPSKVPNKDKNVPWWYYYDDGPTTTVQAWTKQEGSYAAQLSTSYVETWDVCDVVHGPALYSDTFAAAQGETVSFGWSAQYESDYFHVFGYLVDEAGNQTDVLDATGISTGWTTKSAVIPRSGVYRFVFVSGTYDETCGTVAGASLFIDDVQVPSTEVTDAVAQQVARKLTYANASHNPPASRTVTATARGNDNASSSDVITVNITPIDEPPVIATDFTPPAYTNTRTSTTFATSTGTFSAVDPEGDPFAFGIDGGIAGDVTVGGTTYTHRKVGTYGTFSVDATSGAYAFVPDNAAIRALNSAASETYQLTATANGLTGYQPFVVSIAIEASAPSAPTTLTASPRDWAAVLSWTAPRWRGGSAITGYQIESSADGTTWTVHTANTGSPEQWYTVTGLAAGVESYFRVSAINVTGTSDPSTAVSVTPHHPVASVVDLAPAPDGPTVREVVPGQVRLLVDGVPQPSTLTVVDGALRVTGEGFTLDLQGKNAAGKTLKADSDGRLVVVADGAVQVIGSGFRPGSIVDVWLFSTPYLLGKVVVAADGTFTNQLALPAGVELGAHTVQLNGIAANDAQRSVSVGLLVAADPAVRPGQLPYTGAELRTTALWALTIIVLGALGLTRTRRTTGRLPS